MLETWCTAQKCPEHNHCEGYIYTAHRQSHCAVDRNEVRFRATATHFAMLRGCFLGGPPATNSAKIRLMLWTCAHSMHDKTNVSTTLKVPSPRSHRTTRNVLHTACSIAACNTHNVSRTLLALDVNLRREVDRRGRTFLNTLLKQFCACDPMIHTYEWLPAIPLPAHPRKDCRT